MDSSKGKILVTGGAGYIGSHTVRELISRGFSVVVYDNLSHGHKEFIPKEAEFIEADLADGQKLGKVFREHKFDAVVHFAAYAYVGESVENPSKYFNNNLVNSIVLLDCMNKFGVKKMVFSSSCAVYGIPESNPIGEDMHKNPISPYGFSKFAFENILDSYDRAYGLKSASLRYFNAAGAMPDGSMGEWHEPETHIIPLMFDSISKGNLKIFGIDHPTQDGTCIRDYIHVCDLAEAHTKALEYLIRGGPSIKLNLGLGRGVSVLELAMLVERTTGKKMDCQMAPRRAGDPPVLVANPDKARKILGWHAKFSIEEMISHAWIWHCRMRNYELEGILK